MKPRHLVAFAILAVVAGAFVGCSMLGTDIPTRISDFVTSLNGDTTQTYTNLVVGSAAYTATQGQTTLWDTHFPKTDGTYTETITSAAPYDPTGVLVDITASGTGLAKSYKFVLVSSGGIFDDYLISDIQVSSSGTYTTIF